MAACFGRGWLAVWWAMLVLAACQEGGGSTQPAGPFSAPGLGFPLDPDPLGPVTATPAFGTTRFEQPTFCIPVPGLGPDASPGAANPEGAVVVGEKTGRVWLLTGPRSAPTATVFLDLRTDLAIQTGELGLFALAFDPEFAGSDPTRRVAYLSFTRLGPMRSVLSRFRLDPTAPATTPRLDPASEEVLLEVSQPFGNHNGGHIEFDPDGMLLLSLGDGGSAGDPYDNGQNEATLLGSILRLDVRGTPDPGLGYAIPPDNPFAGADPNVARPEVWAFGLRNPWRFCVDPTVTNRTSLIVGDVGQGAREEITRMHAGENHGWRLREGRLPFAGSAHHDPAEPLVEPLWDYPRSLGRSVSGGRVYQGSALPSLAGRYVFGDYASGRVWALAPGAADPSQIAEIPAVVSFHEDHDGELLAVSIAGTVFRLEPSGAPPSAAAVPDTLSATGLFADLADLTPAVGVYPYDVAAPFWSGPVATQKARWLGLPGPLTLPSPERRDTAFVAPTGTVAVKHFENADGVRIETRVLVRTRDGWRGYAYRWNVAGTDATLLPDAAVVSATDDDGNPGTHVIPSRTDCFGCHARDTGLLGVSLPQWPIAQRRAFRDRGLLSGDIEDPGLPEPYVDPADASAPPSVRAHAWLSANCSACHRPDTGIGSFDLRATTPLELAGLVDAPASSGPPGALLVERGDPDASVLLQRLNSTTDGVRMPPLPTLPPGVTEGPEPDPDAVALLRAWIQGL
jgi:glucose/arabinose dehydrogenase